MPMQLDGITLTADDHGAGRTHAVDRGSVDVQAIRRHFVFPGVGRVAPAPFPTGSRWPHPLAGH
jgi:hypothetical protein